MATFPLWTMVPFAVLVLMIATLPLVLPRLWARHGFQMSVVLLCATAVAAYLFSSGHSAHLFASATSYLSFVATVGALYTVASHQRGQCRHGATT